jgi:hypothetical protein
MKQDAFWKSQKEKKSLGGMVMSLPTDQKIVGSNPANLDF